MSKDGMRLDAYLVSHGLVSGRDRAKSLITQGAVQVNGKTITKSSFCVPAEAVVECDTTSVRFVGRGGLKLEKALHMSGISAENAVAMDVGASTGGFTDCLLQNGAVTVYAVDIGHDQLHPSLREDKRVVVLEDTDIRSERLRQIVPAGSVDICAIDVSFISLKQVLPSVIPFLKPESTVLCLIKPQFEAGRSGVGKKGVVRDARVHGNVLREMCGVFEQNGLRLQALDFSPVTGGEGNIEFLAVLRYSDTAQTATVDIREVVEKAHITLKK